MLVERATDIKTPVVKFYAVLHVIQMVSSDMGKSLTSMESIYVMEILPIFFIIQRI